MFFLFVKQGKSIAISLYFVATVILTLLNSNNLNIIAKVLCTIPGLSKHFFEIFPNFIWESSLNLYIWINLNYYENETKQSFSFQKNHDILYQIIKIIVFKF